MKSDKKHFSSKIMWKMSMETGPRSYFVFYKALYEVKASALQLSINIFR